MEKRAFVTEIRAAGESEDSKVAGIGIVYDQWTELWPGYRERISKGAVQMAPTVKSYFNHDPGKVLSTLDSTPALVLRDTDAGLEYTSPIPPTSYGKDLEINLSRGNVKGSSFSFDIPSDGDKRWEESGVYYRDITKLNLYEIGPVTDPAYIQTTASVRAKESLESWKAEQKPAALTPLSLCEKRQKLAESL